MPSALPELTPAAICAIIVTYNPDDFSLQSIRTIVEEAADVVILDNHSGESSLQNLRSLRGDRVTLVESAENTGIAGGLNRGIQAAAEKGYQWFLLFDQDTKILPTTIPALIDAYARCFSELGPKLGFLGSNFQLHVMQGEHGFEGSAPVGHNKPWSTGNLVLTSGTLIHWENFQALGPFREDFFIDHVDHEYQLRALRRGLVVARTAQPVVVHRLGLQRKRRAWLALGQKKMTGQYSPLRRYYQIRNFAALAREYENEFPEIIVAIRKSIKRETFRALKYEGGRGKNLVSIWLALRDGRRGITGKYNGRITL